MKLKDKLKQTICVISLVGMLSSPLIAQEITRENVPAINPASLTAIEFGVYSEEYPIYVVALKYDTDYDGWEDAKFVYLSNPQSSTLLGTDILLEYAIDWNKNHVYEDREIIKSDWFEQEK